MGKGQNKPGRVGTPLCPRVFKSAWADKTVPTLPGWCLSEQLVFNPSGHKRWVTRPATHLNPRSAKGFTLLELAVVVCVVTVLLTVFLNRVLFYQEQAEKWTMVEVVNATQSALNMQELDLLIKGQDAKLGELVKVNPINWLDPKPPNYAGEFFDPAADSVAPGNWAFDLKTHEMIYFPEHTGHLALVGNGKKWIRFRVHLVTGWTPDVSGKGNVAGISFGPVEPYHWEI